jgi:hypothetical protein
LCACEITAVVPFANYVFYDFQLLT